MNCSFTKWLTQKLWVGTLNTIWTCCRRTLWFGMRHFWMQRSSEAQCRRVTWRLGHAIFTLSFNDTDQTGVMWRFRFAFDRRVVQISTALLKIVTTFSVGFVVLQTNTWRRPLSPYSDSSRTNYWWPSFALICLYIMSAVETTSIHNPVAKIL
jgi:hypothetical protein